MSAGAGTGSFSEVFVEKGVLFGYSDKMTGRRALPGFPARDLFFLETAAAVPQ